MLNSYNKTDTLQNFLGFDDGTIHTAEYTPEPELSILQKWDNFDKSAFLAVEEANESFEMAHEDAKNKIVNAYYNAKQSFSDTAYKISNGINISKNVVLASGVLILSIGAWKLIGKDLYYIAKGK